MVRNEPCPISPNIIPNKNGNVKMLNKMTDEAAHALIAVPDLTLEKFQYMRALNFTNWTDFRQNMQIPESAVRGIQAIVKNSKDEVEKFWLKKSLDQIAAYGPLYLLFVSDWPLQEYGCV